MTNLVDLKNRNQSRWGLMTINTNRSTMIEAAVARLSSPSAMVQYADVEHETGVPRNVIAVIHERESSQRWDRSLAQGDPWNQVSTHVPRGRGPFKSWKEAAIDALKNCAPFAARWTDWSPGGTLTLLEQYNGLGYAARGLPSPYIWASTNQYISGKFVADGVFDPGTVDQQIGCAALLKKIPSVISIPVPPPLQPSVQPQQKAKVPSNFVQTVLEFILKLFSKRG